MYAKLWTSKYFKNICYAVILIISTLFNNSIYTNNHTKNSSSYLLAALSAISLSTYSDILDCENYITYSASLLLSQESFSSFDILSMSNDLNKYLYYTECISNAFIVDRDMSIKYGLNDADLLGIQYRTHIENALKGIPSYCSTFLNELPFVQISFPIYSSQEISDETTTISLEPRTYDITDFYSPHSFSYSNIYPFSYTQTANPFNITSSVLPQNALPSGALTLTYCFDHLESKLERLKLNAPHLNAYLIDTNGRIITCSSNEDYLLHNRIIDIVYIRELLDYDPYNSFYLFDKYLVNAVYYTIPGSNWTLLVTVSANPNSIMPSFTSLFYNSLSYFILVLSDTAKKNKQESLPLTIPYPTNL